MASAITTSTVNWIFVAVTRLTAVTPIEFADKASRENMVLALAPHGLAGANKSNLISTTTHEESTHTEERGALRCSPSSCQLRKGGSPGTNPPHTAAALFFGHTCLNEEQRRRWLLVHRFHSLQSQLRSLRRACMTLLTQTHTQTHTVSGATTGPVLRPEGCLVLKGASPSLGPAQEYDLPYGFSRTAPLQEIGSPLVSVSK